MSGRAIAATVYDMLSGDACLGELLDTRGALTQQGSMDYCDQPPTSHEGRPIRRFEQGWPSGFERAVVAFGGFSRAPFSVDTVHWLESWSFRAGVWCQKTVTDNSGGTHAGDLWAEDIHNHVVRILGWDQLRAPAVCTAQDVIVMQRNQDGDVTDLTWDAEHGYWMHVSQFRWVVVSRGLVAPVAL